jgi:hypothetical protein
LAGGQDLIFVFIFKWVNTQNTEIIEYPSEDISIASYLFFAVSMLLNNIEINSSVSFKTESNFLSFIIGYSVLDIGYWIFKLISLNLFHYRPMDDWMNGLLDGCVSKT